MGEVISKWILQGISDYGFRPFFILLVSVAIPFIGIGYLVGWLLAKRRAEVELSKIRAEIELLSADRREKALNFIKKLNESRLEFCFNTEKLNGEILRLRNAIREYNDLKKKRDQSAMRQTLSQLRDDVCEFYSSGYQFSRQEYEDQCATLQKVERRDRYLRDFLPSLQSDLLFATAINLPEIISLTDGAPYLLEKHSTLHRLNRAKKWIPFWRLRQRTDFRAMARKFESFYRK